MKLSASDKGEAEERRGLICPRCGCAHFLVLWTRQREDRVVRRRECRYCGKRVLTSERVVG